MISNKFLRIVLFIVFAVFTAYSGEAQTVPDTVYFTVSMDAPATHYFHVEMECDGKSETDYAFKMPIWTPGYYWRLNFAKNVTNFSAENENGNKLEYTKADLNTWQIKGIKEGKVKISYDVFAYERSVADPFLDDGRAFISPTGIYLFREGLIQKPVVVKIKPYKSWTTVNTGLDKVAGKKNTWFAKNFDVLYDCPVLAGNMEILSFETGGIPYTIAMENPAEFDRATYISDFKKIIESATKLIGDVPYDHYSFLIMDQGMGGLEHSNSMAVFSNSNYDITNSEGYKGWLSFISHEFFHLYNVKRIRPIALGPFDYCNENLTHMLWVAEGFTVYYEYMVLNRAGLMPRQEVLDAFSSTIARFENKDGRKILTATLASYDTWLNFFNWNNHTDHTTISYYNIGCALGMLLDLKIRQETGNEKSLDDVMRTIYYDLHKKQNRGYTDDEFREICEKMAGCSLEEIFHYAETTDPMDYQKYLNSAGIEMNLTPEKQLSYGITVRKNGEDWVITDIDRNSPAWKIGLSIKDRIVLVDGNEANSENLEKIKNPQEEGTINLKIERRSGVEEFTVESFVKESCNYKMKPAGEISQKQAKFLDSWIME